MFPALSGEEYDNFTTLTQKLRSDYDFGHTTNAKFLPRGEIVSGPIVRLFKPFDELFVDFQVYFALNILVLLILFFFFKVITGILVYVICRIFR